MCGKPILLRLVLLFGRESKLSYIETECHIAANVGLVAKFIHFLKKHN